MLELERQRRKQMWETLIAEGGPKNVDARLIHDRGLYGGGSISTALINSLCSSVPITHADSNSQSR